MDTLDRFLVREFIGYFVFVLLLLSALYVGVDFLSKFWNMTMPISRILELYGYKLPAAVQQFIPVASLMATLLVLATMSAQNEILALYSSGIGTLRLVSTFIAAVATVSTVSFLIFDSLVPAFNKKQVLLERGLDPSSEAIIGETRAGFWYRSGSLLYNVGNFNPTTNTMEDLNAYQLDQNFELREAVHAKSAKYGDNSWTMQNGSVTLYPADTKFPTASHFESKPGIIPEKPTDFKTLTVQEDTMRLRDLRRYINRNASYGMDTTPQRVSYHERVALVFTPLVFALLGIQFSLRPLKSYSTAKSVAFCFLVVFIYLLMFRMTLSIGKGGHIPPIVAGWLPNALFLTIAVSLLFRRRRA